MAKRKLTYQQLLKKNKALEAKIEELNKEIEYLDFTSSMNQFDVTAYEYMEEVQYKNSRDVNKKKKKGADAGNITKKSKAEQRREKIKVYRDANPNPETKGLSLEGHLIKKLVLKDSKGKDLSERTVKNDLKIIDLEKR